MKKYLFVTYGVVCYFIFLATFLYLIGFIENAGQLGASPFIAGFFPKSLDDGNSSFSMPLSIIINFALIALFGIQHSVMARSSFKKRWTRWVPKAIERSTYVLIASALLILLMFAWQPITGTVWSITNSPAGTIVLGISLMGWPLLLLSTFLINHFDLFGLRQVFLNARHREIEPIRFRTPLLYRMVRHPLYLSFMLIFWFAPVMTWGHLLFAGAMTLYIIIGMNYEEQDLIKTYPDQYPAYRERVPKILPFASRGK